MKNSVKKLIVSLMAIAMFVYVGASIYKNQAPVNAVTVDITATDVSDNYDINEKVAFPLTIDVDYNGSTKTASDGILVFPSGKIVKITESAIAFSELGEYKLRYFFKDGVVNVTAEKTFKVSSELYYLTSTGGSITPVTAEMNAASDFDSLDDNTMNTEKEGIILRLAEGCAFKYNKPINLKDADANGLASIISLDTRLYDITGLNNTVFVYDKQAIASYVKIKLTDCYEPGTFAEILLQMSGGTVYTRVGTNHQTDGGLKYPDSSNVNNTVKEYYVGSIRGVCRLGNYGQWQHGYGSTTIGKNSNGGAGALNFYYDYENQRLYANNSKKPVEEAVMVNDLRSTSIYGTNLFDGFTTGEVFVSVECATYNLSKEGRVDILSIGNDQGDYLVESYYDANNPTDYLVYEDKVAPAIKFPATDLTKVYCEKGDSFILPEAVAYDVNLVGGVETRVYRNYNSANKASVNIVNGAIKIDAVDTYYIEYSAVDKYGNRGVEVFRVYGVDTGTGKSLSVDTEPLTSLKAGENTALPAFTVATVNDPSKVSLDIVAKCAKETINIGSYTGLDVINEVGASGLSFIPKYAGEYTISFILKDDIYDRSDDPFEYKVNCVASDAVAFLDTPFLERYLIKNATYGLREFNAYEFTKGEPNAKKVTAYISFDGGEFTEIADVNKILITGEKTAQVKYAVNDENYILSDVVSIVDVQYGMDYTIKMKDYFQYEDGAFTVEEFDDEGWELTDIIYRSTKTTGSNKLSFVNSLFYDKLNVEYKVDKSYGNFERVNIILTDVKDPSYKTKITVGRNMLTSYISINDGLKYAYDRAFAMDSFVTVAYDKSVRKLVVGKTVIDYDISLPSGRAYLDIELDGIYGESGIHIRTINNQKLLGESHDDTNVPEISVKRTTGNFNVGEVVTIYAPDYADILSPIDLTTMTYSVKFGDTFMRSVDGVLLDGSNSAFKDVQIKLDNLGEYSVIYSAKDIYGNYVSARYYLSATDRVAPVITVDDYQEGYIYNVKLGQKITISYQVSDNVTPDEECHVAVMVTNMTSYSNTYWNRSDQEEGFVLGECSFFIIEEGLHRVDLICRDKAGNYVYKTYNFMVKA